MRGKAILAEALTKHETREQFFVLAVRKLDRCAF